jgi:hypothetical protein
MKSSKPDASTPIVTSASTHNAARSKTPSPSGTQPRSKPKAPPVTVRRKSGPESPEPGTKTAKLLALLKRPRGATLRELQEATGWQPHSVRGFLSGIVGRKMGLKVRSTKAESGERRYAVRG